MVETVHTDRDMVTNVILNKTLRGPMGHQKMSPGTHRPNQSIEQLPKTISNQIFPNQLIQPLMHEGDAFGDLHKIGRRINSLGVDSLNLACEGLLLGTRAEGLAAKAPSVIMRIGLHWIWEDAGRRPCARYPQCHQLTHG
jgi:hypothetical protein